MDHNFSIGDFSVRYSQRVTRDADPTTSTTIEMAKGGEYPRARVTIFFDSPTVEIFSAEGEDETLHPDIKEVDSILTERGFPTLTEIEDKVNERDAAWEEDPMGHPSQYESQARTVVESLLAEDATSIYDKARSEHEEWWTPYHQGDVDIDEFADELFDKICSEYSVDPDSPTGQEIYNHVYAGLT
jgi:hypothetical protein